MKKLLAFMLALSMTIFLAACGGSKSEPAAPTPAPAPTETTQQPEETPTEPEEEPSEEDLIEDEGWDELEALGQIQTENGILTVSITMPADLVGEEVTQEELDANAGENYISAKLNDDGSVTYKLTKKQHKAMMDGMVEGMESSFQEMIDDPDFSYTEIKHNKDFTQFDVTVSGDELNLADSIGTLAFYMYGGLYGIFSGHTAENVIINFYNASGELINTADSANLGG